MIPIPAPWQSGEGIEESSGFDREDHITEELSIEELTALVGSAEESLTPISEVSDAIATRERSEARNNEDGQYR